MNDGLVMLGACRIISSNRDDGISSFIEPDDTLDLYIDFLEEFSDWGNDNELMDLMERVFQRRTEEP